MPKRTHARPRFEVLEDRTCPALTTVALDGSGNLRIIGTPDADVTLTYVGTSVTVDDGATPYGPFNVTGNVNMTLGNDIISHAVNLDLDGSATAASINMTLGNILGGGYTVNLPGGGTQGTITGNLNITSGNGDDTVNLTGTAVTSNQILGRVFINLGGDANSADTVDIDATNVGGGVTIVNAETITINAFLANPMTIGGSLVMTSTEFGGTINNSYSVGNFVSIAGSVIMTTGNTNSDVLTFAGLTNGALVASLGNATGATASNSVTIGSTGVVLGNLTVVAGNARTNSVVLNGTGTAAVVGNVVVFLGNSIVTNTINFQAGFNIQGNKVDFFTGNGPGTINVHGTAIGAALRVRTGNTTAAAPGQVRFNVTAPFLARTLVELGKNFTFLPPPGVITYPFVLKNL